MAKKRKKNWFLASYGGFIILVIGIIAFSMMYLPAIKYELSGTELSGIDAVFGKKTKFGDLYKFNYFAFAGYVLAFAAGILALFNRKKLLLVSALLFILACVTIAFERKEFIFINEVEDIESLIEIMFGPILGAIFAGIGAFVSLVCAMIAKK